MAGPRFAGGGVRAGVGGRAASAAVPGAPMETGVDDKTVLFSLDGQWCGLPVSGVRDILDRFELSPVPLAPREVAGNLNLRGRIVTAIDLRDRLRDGAAAGTAETAKQTAIVVEHDATLYALLVDQVSEVVSLPPEKRRSKPVGLPPTWGRFTSGVYERDDCLLAVLDLGLLLALDGAVH